MCFWYSLRLDEACHVQYLDGPHMNCITKIFVPAISQVHCMSTIWSLLTWSCKSWKDVKILSQTSHEDYWHIGQYEHTTQVVSSCTIHVVLTCSHTWHLWLGQTLDNMITDSHFVGSEINSHSSSYLSLILAYSASSSVGLCLNILDCCCVFVVPGVSPLWGGCVAAQYSSSHPHRWSLASSRLFSCRMMSHISRGHWASFSAATICTFMFLVWDLPRDFMSLWRTLGDEICR